MQPMANMALRAARLAGKQIIRAFDRPDLIKVSEKGHNDYVTNVDKEVESIVINTLRDIYPDHRFVGEEGTETDTNIDSDYHWIIDPIDGTSNFVHNLPHFCVSIACIYKGKLEHGVIIDPVREEEFVASRGKGMQINGRRTRIRDQKELDGALISTGGVERGDMATRQGALYGELLNKGVTLRNTGSAALDLAYIASGRLDAMWMHELKLWDMAAGALMVLESGGLLGDFNGGSDYIESGNIIAAPPKLFRYLTPVVKKHLGDV